MGNGNWRPGRTGTMCSLVYVDLSPVSEDELDRMTPEERADVHQAADPMWRAFFEDLCSALALGGIQGLEKLHADSWQFRLWLKEHGWERGHPYYATEHLCVVYDTDADDSHIGVAICPLPRDDDKEQEEAGRQFLAFDSSGLWDRMAHKGYKLSTRKSAWVSAPYVPTTPAPPVRSANAH